MKVNLIVNSNFSPMKVLFLPFYYPNNPYQYLLLKELEIIGVEVICVTNETQLYLFSNFKFYKELNIIHFHWTNPYMFDKSAFRTICKSIKFFIELLILKIIGIKIVYTVHNIKNHQNRYLKIELFFLKVLIMFVFNKLIVHGGSVKEELLNAFKLNTSYINKMVVISHGHYIDYYDNCISKDEARVMLGIPKDVKVFLYFGLIRQYKGIPELINSFKKLTDKSAYLIIAGYPNDIGIMNFLNKQSCTNIIVVQRFIPDDQIQRYMNAAEIVVLPYRDILTSGCLLLAMSFGKALIVPDLGCLSDTLDENGGILYNADDENGLLNSMNAILQMDFESMGKYNKEKLSETYGWDLIARKTKEAYESVI